MADEVLDPSDPRVRETEAFPSLTADQVKRVSSFGRVQQLQRGTVLYEPGCRTADFFLVLDGLIEIYVSRRTTQEVVDDNGFVRTGISAASDDPASSHALSQPLATSCPGIFAVGDVRSGSIKRVASAVGEGSIVIAAVHQALDVL